MGVVEAAPDDHFAACPHCRVTRAPTGRTGDGGRNPAVCAWIVSAACIQVAWAAAPDDHFAASPHRRVSSAPIRRVCGGSSNPSVCARIVSTAGV